MENHHHCVICGDVIDASERICSKISCVRKYGGKEVRCHKMGSNYIFKPGNCVETCIGYKVNIDKEDGQKWVECCQKGKTPPDYGNN